MKEKKFIAKAKSNENGIIFYSHIYPFIGYETFRDDSGQIQSRIISTHLEQFITHVEPMNKKEETFDKWNVVIFDIILIGICILLRNFWFVFAATHFSITVSFDLFEFIQISYQMKSKKGKYRSKAKFHAAEHMIANAYQKLQRVPTLDELKTFSRFYKKCGSRKVLIKISTYTLISLAIAFVANWNSLIYCLLIILIAIFMIIAERKGWLSFLQVFITNIPSDSELEVAIEGIKNFEKMEEKIKGIIS